MSIKADIAEMTQKDVEKVIKSTEAVFGPIEMVVCCAGMSKPKLFMHMDPKEFEHHMNLNFHGPLKLINPIVKRML